MPDGSWEDDDVSDSQMQRWMEMNREKKEGQMDANSFYRLRWFKEDWTAYVMSKSFSSSQDARGEWIQNNSYTVVRLDEPGHLCRIRVIGENDVRVLEKITREIAESNILNSLDSLEKVERVMTALDEKIKENEKENESHPEKEEKTVPEENKENENPQKEEKSRPVIFSYLSLEALNPGKKEIIPDSATSIFQQPQREDQNRKEKERLEKKEKKRQEQVSKVLERARKRQEEGGGEKQKEGGGEKQKEGGGEKKGGNAMLAQQPDPDVSPDQPSSILQVR